MTVPQFVLKVRVIPDGADTWIALVEPEGHPAGEFYVGGKDEREAGDNAVRIVIERLRQLCLGGGLRLVNAEEIGREEG